MLIPEKAPGNIKWKTVEELNSLYYAEDTNGILVGTPLFFQRRERGAAPLYRAEIHVLFCRTLGGRTV